MRCLTPRYPIVLQKTLASFRSHRLSQIGCPSTKAFPDLQVPPVIQMFPAHQHGYLLPHFDPVAVVIWWLFSHSNGIVRYYFTVSLRAWLNCIVTNKCHCYEPVQARILHVISLCLSLDWHLSLVPSVQSLICLCLPFPHCFPWLVWHCPLFLHGPNFLGQSGLLQVTYRYLSELLHLSLVPSIQLLVCLWFPGPQYGSVPIATHDPTLYHVPSTLGQSFRLQDVVSSLSRGWHLSFVPSSQLLVFLCRPGPHDLSEPMAMQASKTQIPSFFGQSGRLHERVLVTSLAVHLSLVPSTQFLVCFWFPGPQDLSVPEAMQPPSLTQSPSSFGQSGRLQEIVFCVIAGVHLYTTPSVHDLVCCWRPGPQVFLLPIALHAPTLFPVSYTHLTLPTICSV